MENKKKVLIVEDDQKTREVLKEALQKEPTIEVWVAEDGQKALEITHQFSPDLLLLDIGIPGMDGITLARTLADEGTTKKTKILFLTNSSDISKISVASTTPGVLGYLIKADWDIADVVKQVKSNL